MKGSGRAVAADFPFSSISRRMGIMFKTAAIEQKTAAIEAFYSAYNEAVDYIKSHPVEDIKTILTEDIGFPEPLVQSVRLPDYTHAGMPQEKDIHAVTVWLLGKKLIPDNFSGESVLNSQFIK